MLEKLLVGLSAFLLSFFPICWLIFKIVHALLWTPAAYNDETLDATIFVRSSACALIAAFVGGILIALGAAYCLGRLTRRRSPDSYRRRSQVVDASALAAGAMPELPLRQEPSSES